MEILRRTPAWVSILFLVLLGFGYLQSRPRVARRNTPLFIGSVSVLYGVWSGFFFARLLRMLRIAKEAKIRAV